ncbi:hypothetical protein BKA82DRAFT_28122 [Pisolithus tinctorius]|uniref:RNA polymerase Rpb1 domain-containing protein n=1 Tax=Pisolithus tinctorius Marx 270 TaxID=870435 RepID=A0A0C3P426_PISTI|nr:hypothetical protein BKA82DRAFT_28122 [Pisolithus tinctorius]KIO02216.1 hypothetical protein M404DRAFT_28122 [Pisolithus tinctorius Marx 270]
MAQDRMSAKNVQQELAYTSLRIVTTTVEIWYDPEPTSTIIEGGSMFIEFFFAILDEEIESKLHLQSPCTFGWCLIVTEQLIGVLLWSPTASLRASRHTSSSSGAKVTWRNRQGAVEEDIFLCQFKNTMLNSVSLHSIHTPEAYADDEGSIKTNGGVGSGD